MAFGVLTGQKKGFDQLAFPADRHSRKPLEPLALGYVRFGIEPLCQELQLRCRNLPALDSIEQMLEEGRRDVLAADLRHDAIF